MKTKTAWIDSAGCEIAIADSKEEACELWQADNPASLAAGLSNIDDFGGAVPEYKTETVQQIVNDRVSYARDRNAPGWDDVMQAAKDGRLWKYN